MPPGSPTAACRAALMFAAVSGAALCAHASTTTVQASGDDSAVSEVVVTARRLNEARATIHPDLGASVYTIDSKAMAALPGGDDVSLNQIVLQAPGVAQDSFGQLHVRGEHNGLQFRLNGVILPEGLSVFSQALSPRLAEKVELITGALPAQYGLRTAGIVDITTRSDPGKPEGEMSIYGGAHDLIEPSLQAAGGSGAVNAFVSASYTHSRLGVESPDGSSTPLHDVTDQFEAFAYVEDILDPNDRASLILGVSDQAFQIPNRVGLSPSIFLGPNGDQPLNVGGVTSYDSAALNQRQREATWYGVVSLLHTAGSFTGQASLFGRYSLLGYTPDPLGDLLFDGIAQTAHKTDGAVGTQVEGAYRLGEAHVLRGGLIAQVDHSTTHAASQVIPLATDGSQASTVPVTITDNGGHTAWTVSLYGQDEFHLASGLTLNYGLRFDAFHGFRDENQLSPRVNLVWKASALTTLHAGYARYFSPPPFELVGAKGVALFNATTAASAIGLDDTPRAERADYFDVGASRTLGRGFTAEIDAYYKTSRNLVDEGQFGAPIILTPFNYARGRQYGAELSASYNRGPVTAYANLAWSRGEGRGIVSSQFNFDPAELAYITDHWIHLDHDQTWTGSAGGSWRVAGVRLGADMLVGSGLRATGADGVPNGLHLPAYVQVNLSISHHFERAAGGPFDLRLDVTNVFDARYEIRDGSGVGVGAPQFGPRRGVFAGLTKSF